MGPGLGGSLTYPPPHLPLYRALGRPPHPILVSGFSLSWLSSPSLVMGTLPAGQPCPQCNCVPFLWRLLRSDTPPPPTPRSAPRQATRASCSSTLISRPTKRTWRTATAISSASASAPTCGVPPPRPACLVQGVKRSRSRHQVSIKSASSRHQVDMKPCSQCAWGYWHDGSLVLSGLAGIEGSYARRVVEMGPA